MVKGSTQKQIVGVAVTPNVGVEVILVDKKTNKVTKYGRRPLEYNSSTREIQDYSIFKGLVIDLFNELGINTKSNVHVVLPNVHFDFVSLPLIINDEAVANAILAQAEESYVFKRVEPVSAWMDVNNKANANRSGDNRYLVYSSIQKNAVDKITEVFQDIGSNLIGIETSYSALLRAVAFVGLAREQIMDGQNWNLLLVNPNSYAIFALAGDKIIDYSEVPLAIKSFSVEEAYQAITNSAAQVLPDYPARKLVVVSQTDDISAELLRGQLIFDEEMVALDCNKYTKKPFVSVGEQFGLQESRTISLSAIGAATYGATDFALALNVMAQASTTAYISVDLFGKEVLLTSEFVRNICILITIVVGLILGGLYGGLTYANNTMSEKKARFESETAKIQEELDELEGKNRAVDINVLIAKIIGQNKSAINFYDSLASDIPKSLWLNYYYNKDGDKVAIEGLSADINSIYLYYSGLKVISPASSIKLNRLKILTDSIGGDYDFNADNDIRVYDFEIGNTPSKRGKPAQPQQPENPADAMSPPGVPPVLEPLPEGI